MLVAVLGCSGGTDVVDGGGDGSLDARADAAADADAATDSAMSDAAELPCDPAGGDACPAGLDCLCCAIGKGTGCFCTTACATAADCADPRPTCDHDTPGSDAGVCTSSDLVCQIGICASADTRIATPEGERRITAIAVGDIVYGMRDGQLAPVPVLRVSRTHVCNHSVVRVTLRAGAFSR